MGRAWRKASSRQRTETPQNPRIAAGAASVRVRLRPQDFRTRMPPPPSRRSILAGAASLGLATAARAAGPAGFGPVGRPSWSGDSLQAAASAKGLLYGCEVPFHRFDSTPAYRQAVARECGLLVCG